MSVPPRPGKTPYWSVRGTHLGVYLDRSTRLTDERKARKKLRQWQDEIERGEFVGSKELTFVAAAVAYMKGGGDRTYIAKLLDYFGDRPLAKIDQTAVDQAAMEIYPHAAPATRNRQVYTPVSAILHHADPERGLRLRRPKGDTVRTRWLQPDEAERLIANAPSRIQPLIIFLLYTGCRLGEAIALEWSDVDLQQQFAYLAETKTGTPRGVYLPEPVVVALANLPDRAGRVFGYQRRWSCYKPWAVAIERAGLPGLTYHHLRHTYATWMRRYGGLDLRGLIGTGAWKDLKSVARYTHVIASEESRAADRFPALGKSVETRKR